MCWKSEEQECNVCIDERKCKQKLNEESQKYFVLHRKNNKDFHYAVVDKTQHNKAIGWFPIYSLADIFCDFENGVLKTNRSTKNSGRFELVQSTKKYGSSFSHGVKDTKNSVEMAWFSNRDRVKKFITYLNHVE